MYFTATQIVDEIAVIFSRTDPEVRVSFFTQFGRLWDWDSLYSALIVVSFVGSSTLWL